MVQFYFSMKFFSHEILSLWKFSSIKFCFFYPVLHRNCFSSESLWVIKNILLKKNWLVKIFIHKISYKKIMKNISKEKKFNQIIYLSSKKIPFSWAIVHKTTTFPTHFNFHLEKYSCEKTRTKKSKNPDIVKLFISAFLYSIKRNKN